ncbi:MAG TPA: hypothetical protein VFT37_01020 [Telluria sp.]|nr:hypothetical protein [Telluria sp.]
MESALQRPELMPTRPGRLALGIGASIVAHAILLLAYRIESLPAIAPEEAPPVESLVILVKPKPPEPAPVVARAEPVKKPASTARPATTKDTAREEDDAPTTETVIAVEPTPATAPDPFYVPPAPKEKAFDIDAARAAARRIATSPDPARADMPVAQFDKERDRVKPQLTKSERAIANAGRADCKDGIPGGLLAPIILLFDKKDHGCKW